MKDRLKQALLHTLPIPTQALLDYRHRRHIRHFEKHMGLPSLIHDYLNHNSLEVQGGPFAGMIYVPEAVGSALLPKLVGSYEAELATFIAQISNKPYDVIVDVGCAEGYYAVGLARLFPHAHVFAFDLDSRGRQLCQAMAVVNKVETRVTVSAKCDVTWLDNLLSDRSLVVSDCEGYEIDLLCPNRCRGLMTADILVELHDAIVAEATQTIVGRFSKTHTISLVTCTKRNPGKYPTLTSLPLSQRELAVNEFRNAGQCWAFMEANKAVSEA